MSSIGDKRFTDQMTRAIVDSAVESLGDGAFINRSTGVVSAVGNTTVKVKLLGDINQSFPDYAVRGFTGLSVGDVVVVCDDGRNYWVESFIPQTTFMKLVFGTNGTIQWGSGTSAADTNLYRSGTSTLTTDGSLSVGGTLSATTFNPSSVSTTGNISTSGGTITSYGSISSTTGSISASLGSVSAVSLSLTGGTNFMCTGQVATGSGTGTATAAVTFPFSFSSAPRVFANPLTSSATYYAQAYSVTTTGCSVRVSSRNSGDALNNISIQWLAISSQI